MVCGEVGLGKTSLVELFLKSFDYEQTEELYADFFAKKTSQPNFGTFSARFQACKEFELTATQADDRSFTFRVIDTPGYGKTCDLDEWREAIQMSLKNRMKQHQAAVAETKRSLKHDPVICRRRLRELKDKRIHALLFLFGGSDRVKNSDLIIVKKLSRFVNVIPIVAMADRFGEQELVQLKGEIVTTACDRAVYFFNCNDALAESSLSPGDELFLQLL